MSNQPDAQAGATPSIDITGESFTGMVTIKIEDDLTHQILVITPDEAAALRDELNRFTHSDAGDEAKNRESRQLRALTLYNGHSLPSIDRAAFESRNEVTQRFHFVVHQVIENISKVVGRL